MARWVQAAVDALTFPPSLVLGLLAGLVFRRRIVAMLFAGILSPLANHALDSAFSDPPPRLDPEGSLLAGGGAMLMAAVVWSVARSVRRRRSTMRQAGQAGQIPADQG